MHLNAILLEPLARPVENRSHRSSSYVANAGKGNKANQTKPPNQTIHLHRGQSQQGLVIWKQKSSVIQMNASLCY